jgi:transcriptional regulator with XRE-family HTH domain
MSHPTVAHLPRPDLGDRIRRAREARGLTRTELAARIGRTEQTQTCWEKGRRTPSIANLQVIAEALDMRLADMLDGEPEAVAETVQS